MKLLQYINFCTSGAITTNEKKTFVSEKKSIVKNEIGYKKLKKNIIAQEKIIAKTTHFKDRY